MVLADRIQEVIMKTQTSPNNPPCIQNFDCQLQGIGFEAEFCGGKDPEMICKNWDSRWLKPVDSEAFREWVEGGSAGIDIPEEYLVTYKSKSHL